MAATTTSERSPPAAPSQSVPQPTTVTSRPGSGHDTALSSSPVEMRSLPAASAAGPTTNNNTTEAAPNPSSIPEPSAQAQMQTQAAHLSQAADPVVQTQSSPTTTKPPPPSDLNGKETEAIGPSTDTPATKPDTSMGPVVIITLLLTTGARHPYKIDEKYLKKRNVNVEAMDPYNISVYTLKELIWRDWREEWEPRPISPGSIRLIHFGRMLDDKAPLKECRFQTEAPNVVHMTVKPQEVVDEEDAKTGKGGGRRDGDEEATAGCRCVIL